MCLSIEAMQSSINKEELQVDVSPAIIFEYQTIGELASFLPALPNKGKEPIFIRTKKGLEIQWKVS